MCALACSHLVLCRNTQVDGAVLLKGVFSPEWVERVREGIEYNLAHPSPHMEILQPPGSKGRFLNDYLTWRDNPHYKAFITESGVAELAGKLMKSSMAIFYHEHMLTKEPGAASITPWHHDQPYYPVDGDMVRLCVCVIVYVCVIVCDFVCVCDCV